MCRVLYLVQKLVTLRWLVATFYSSSLAVASTLSFEPFGARNSKIGADLSSEYPFVQLNIVSNLLKRRAVNISKFQIYQHKCLIAVHISNIIHTQDKPALYRCLP